MDTLYFKEIREVKYLDPFNDFKEKKISFEIRRDEITGVTSRILPFRFKMAKKPDVQAYLDKSRDAFCPFCPPNFELKTPRFTHDIIIDGRFYRGAAALIPNAFPHDYNNSIAIFSDRHFIGIDEFTPEVMIDGFLVCQDFFKRMTELHPSLQFCAINWNYMPPAGAGLIHPHLQTVMGDSPTQLMKRLLTSADTYREKTGHNLWADLITHEREDNQRYIGKAGISHWMTSFSPKGMAGEITFIIEGRPSMLSLTDQDLQCFLEGLSRILKYFHQSNLISFNMVLYAMIEKDQNFWIQGKVIPRFTIEPLGTSDINYFEKFHDEIICPVIPEEMCKDIKPLFHNC